MNQAAILNRWTHWSCISLSGFTVPPPRPPRLSKSTGKRKVRQYLEENHNSSLTYTTIVKGTSGYEPSYLTTEESKRLRKTIFPIPLIKPPAPPEPLDYKLDLEYAFGFIEKEFVKSIIDGRAYLSDYEREFTYQELFDPFSPIQNKRKRRGQRLKRKRIEPQVDSTAASTPMHSSSSDEDTCIAIKPKFKRQNPESPSIICSCKKSGCCKLYCECFAAGYFCTDKCGCMDCCNVNYDEVEPTQEIHLSTPEGKRTKPEEKLLSVETSLSLNSMATYDLLQTSTPKHISFLSPTSSCSKRSIMNSERGKKRREEAIARILKKNPSAFMSKINAEEKVSKSGCNCKKSNCSKKYCECFANGIGCGPKCHCVNCQNSFNSK